MWDRGLYETRLWGEPSHLSSVMGHQPLPVVVGRDVSLSKVESDLTDLDPSLIPTFDPPAAYTRSPSFHESEVGAEDSDFAISNKDSFANAFLSTTCDPTPDACHPFHFIENLLVLAKESTEKCPTMVQLTDDGSQADSKESLGEDLLVECNKLRRGRFLVWPAIDGNGQSHA